MKLTEKQKESFNTYIECANKRKNCLNENERSDLEQIIVRAKSELLNSLPFRDFLELMKSSSFLTL